MTFTDKSYSENPAGNPTLTEVRTPPTLPLSPLAKAYLTWRLTHVYDGTPFDALNETL